MDGRSVEEQTLPAFSCYNSSSTIAFVRWQHCHSLHSVAGQHGGHAVCRAALIPLGQLEAVVERQRRVGRQIVKGQSLSGIDLQPCGVCRAATQSDCVQAAAARHPSLFQSHSTSSQTSLLLIGLSPAGRYMAPLTL